MSDVKRMTAKEFRELGYLQELNRRFLHPLGLALEVSISEDGVESFGDVWDYRDDPEGVIYDPSMIQPERAKRIERERMKLARSRYDRLGFEIQPADNVTVED
jgi:hypothetical protein